MIRRDELFRPLDPPPGGLALLRERLEERRRRRAWLLAVPAVAAAAAALVIAVQPRPDPFRAQLAGDPFARALGLSAPGEAVQVSRGAAGSTALRRVESGNPDVVVYWADTAARAASDAEDTTAGR